MAYGKLTQFLTESAELIIDEILITLQLVALWISTKTEIQSSLTKVKFQLLKLHNHSLFLCLWMQIGLILVDWRLWSALYCIIGRGPGNLCFSMPVCPRFGLGLYWTKGQMSVPQQVGQDSILACGHQRTEFCSKATTGKLIKIFSCACLFFS